MSPTFEVPELSDDAWVGEGDDTADKEKNKQALCQPKQKSKQVGFALLTSASNAADNGGPRVTGQAISSKRTRITSVASARCGGSGFVFVGKIAETGGDVFVVPRRLESIHLETTFLETSRDGASGVHRCLWDASGDVTAWL